MLSSSPFFKLNFPYQILFISLISFALSEENYPRAKRAITFNHFSSQFKILPESGYNIEKLATQNRRECAIKCLKNSQCKSYSYCRTHCYLNSIGLFELQRNEQHKWFTSSDKNCDLFSMERNFIPQCQEFGLVRSIRDDSDPNNCVINKKRVDGAFLEREYFNASIDVIKEFKGFSTRKCLPETALNGGYCKSKNETEAVWIKWKNTWRNYTDCAKVCEDYGGILFPDLDGDRKQIDFLKRGRTWQVWFGVKTDQKWYLWKNSRDERMTPDRIFWYQFKDNGIGQVLKARRNELSIQSRSPSEKGKVVCQMIV